MEQLCTSVLCALWLAPFPLRCASVAPRHVLSKCGAGPGLASHGLWPGRLALLGRRTCRLWRWTRSLGSLLGSELDLNTTATITSSTSPRVYTGVAGPVTGATLVTCCSCSRTPTGQDLKLLMCVCSGIQIGQDTQSESDVICIKSVFREQLVGEPGWIAADAPADTTEDNVRSAIGVFRTQENALEAGWHRWETNYAVPAGVDWRDTGLSCQTTVLAPV